MACTCTVGQLAKTNGFDPACPQHGDFARAAKARELVPVEPPVNTIKVYDPGKEAFLAFHRAMGGPPPVAWDDLERKAQLAWYHAAGAAFDHFIDVTKGLRKPPTE